jgi:AmmeMemoRadiSam system protein B/AmmeMemoRadiSam system protein A
MNLSIRFWRPVLAAGLLLSPAVGVPTTNAAEAAPAPALTTGTPPAVTTVASPALTTGTPVAASKVREPAVAGLFYPKDAAGLSQIIERCLAAAKSEPGGDLRALICPHAGYPYSGPVAAYAYKLLAGREYETVVVMGPSHYASLSGASVTDADTFRTPLGDVPISAKARALARISPFALEPRCPVQRPDWWQQSSRPAPAVDTADTWEHSVEVEIPFLQKTLKDFKLVPVVMGATDPAKAAQALLQILDDQTLIIASSDLSHYYSYARAQELDQRCVKAICSLDLDGMETEEACGQVPILTLMHLARQQGWKPRLLDCRNSGDTAGDKSRVVGYAAIAFYAPAPEKFTAADRRYLLDLARRTVYDVVTTGRPPDVSAEGLAPKFTESKGCFVTLTKRGDLRGCIGYIVAQGPLYKAVIENARNAAIRDPRFPPVGLREMDQVEIEISVLTAPQPLAFSSPEELLRKLKPHQDGVVLQIGGRGATYLPQVWEQLPDRTEFLNHLAEKAGCEPDAWRQPGATVYIYHVESFKESEVGSAN